jgi:hypothetical protein
MKGITKICTGMMVKILDFTFAGYGFVCDRMLLKIIFQQIRYHYVSCRHFIIKCYNTPFLKEYYDRAADELTALLNLEENEKWYLRGR